MVAFAEEKEAAPPRISREQYLEWESQQEDRNEYDDGIIIKMTGASLPHNRINLNIAARLNLDLEDTDCEAMASDMRVYVPQCNRYLYPDTVVVCAAPELEIIRGVATLLNPLVIIEVLSKSTEKSDRTDKFDCYQTLDSLQTYVLVAQEKPRIEVFDRQTTGEWTETVSEGLEATAKLERINCELSLKRVYARVTFDNEPSSE